MMYERIQRLSVAMIATANIENATRVKSLSDGVADAERAPSLLRSIPERQRVDYTDVRMPVARQLLDLASRLADSNPSDASALVVASTILLDPAHHMHRSHSKELDELKWDLER